VLRRLRPLTEAECYARCYGNGDEAVRVTRAVRQEVRSRPPPVRLSGEDLRRLFEERLDARESTAA
jgi:hypothetical protein